MLAVARGAVFRRINDRFFYGWTMLGVGALGMFASGPGQSHLFSVFITPLSLDLELSRTTISSAYAAATLFAALGLPQVGRLIDRYGVRPVLICVSMLLGLSAIAFGTITNIVLLALGFAVLRLLGQGSLMICSNNLVAQWFSRKRGFALSLMSLGFSLSMALHPPLAQFLIDLVGWRQAWLWLGLLTWVLLLPAVTLLVENRPEDVGLKPDGARAEAASASTESDGHRDDALVGLTLKQAIRTPAFWIIAFSLSTLSMLVTGMFFHQVSILDTQGLSPQMAASVFSLTAISMVVSMPLIGRMLDRFPTKPVFAAALLATSVALMALSVVADAATAIVYSVVFGIANAALHSNLTYVWARFFGRRHLGSIQGAAQMINVVGASIGPLPLGIAYDLYGGYAWALVLLAPLPVVCAGFVLIMKPPSLNR